MVRTIRILLMAMLMGLGLVLVSGPADADRPTQWRPLNDGDLRGVMVKPNARIKINSELYRVVEHRDGLLLKKKKKKKDDTEDVGLTCKCSGDGVCSISTGTDGAARCQGDSCCGWVTISGSELSSNPAQVLGPAM